VNGRSPQHRGVLMGRMARVADGAITIEPDAANSIAPLKPGDGVVFDAADWRGPQEREEGGSIYEVAVREGRLELRFGNGGVAIRQRRHRSEPYVAGRSRASFFTPAQSREACSL
jgi:putative protease